MNLWLCSSARPKFFHRSHWMREHADAMPDHNGWAPCAAIDNRTIFSSCSGRRRRRKRSKWKETRKSEFHKWIGATCVVFSLLFLFGKSRMLLFQPKAHCSVLPLRIKRLSHCKSHVEYFIVRSFVRRGAGDRQRRAFPEKAMHVSCGIHRLRKPLALNAFETESIRTCNNIIVVRSTCGLPSKVIPFRLLSSRYRYSSTDRAVALLIKLRKYRSFFSSVLKSIGK